MDLERKIEEIKDLRMQESEKVRASKEAERKRVVDEKRQKQSAERQWLTERRRLVFEKAGSLDEMITDGLVTLAKGTWGKKFGRLFVSNPSNLGFQRQGLIEKQVRRLFRDDSYRLGVSENHLPVAPPAGTVGTWFVGRFEGGNYLGSPHYGTDLRLEPILRSSKYGDSYSFRYYAISLIDVQEGMHFRVPPRPGYSSDTAPSGYKYEGGVLYHRRGSSIDFYRVPDGQAVEILAQYKCRQADLAPKETRSVDKNELDELLIEEFKRGPHSQYVSAPQIERVYPEGPYRGDVVNVRIVR